MWIKPTRKDSPAATPPIDKFNQARKGAVSFELIMKS